MYVSVFKILTESVCIYVCVSFSKWFLLSFSFVRSRRRIFSWHLIYTSFCCCCCCCFEMFAVSTTANLHKKQTFLLFLAKIIMPGFNVTANTNTHKNHAHSLTRTHWYIHMLLYAYHHVCNDILYSFAHSHIQGKLYQKTSLFVVQG